MSGVTVNEPAAQIAAIGRELNTFLTLLVHRRQARLQFEIARCGEAPHPRVVRAIGYIRRLHALAMLDDPATAFDAPSFFFQAEDNPVGCESVSWEQRRDWPCVRLVPDEYYVAARGYADFLPEVPDWRDRADRLIWRGSSTGILGLTADQLDQLPRYRLARIAREIGPFADVGLTQIVQCPTPEAEAAVTARIVAEDLMRDFVPITDMRLVRYIVDIDGNSNSWNFIQRLRLGACLLKVESGWQQWFADRLMPWHHYVPVAADLSDFVERIGWCRANPGEAARIAAEGRDFAVTMSFEREMRDAARTMFAVR
jgi:hypothetical protein